MKKLILLLIFGLLIAWGVHQNKFTLAITNMGLGKKAVHQPDPIKVHPEVLNLQDAFANVAETVKPSVVNISTIHLEQYQSNPYEFFFMNPEDVFEQFFDFQGAPRQRQSPQQAPQKKYHERKIPGTGSGVIIDPDGFILTNEHVVHEADEINVKIEGYKKTFQGKVIGRDERTDLAVIKIKPPSKLPYAKLGDSDAVRVGDWAIAVGSPFGLEQTVTVGVISASRQNLHIENRIYKDIIQTDAAINPGNSGGPLSNIRGEIIGINTAIYTPSGGFAGIGFAIPINRAKEIIPQLREKGKVVRGWIGVILEEKIDEATASVFSIPDGEGAMIREVLPGYPAEQAGLQRGDVIRKFNGKKVKNNYDLQTFVQAAEPESTVPIEVIRSKKDLTLKMTIQEAPTSLKPQDQEEKPGKTNKETNQNKAKWMGAQVRGLSEGLRKAYSIPEKETGVVVIKIDNGSNAEEIGLRGGDLIRAINQKSIIDLNSFEDITNDIRTKKGVVFDILRQGNPRYLSYMGPNQ